MAFSELDKKRYVQLGALLKKAQFTMNIEEIMAAAQAYAWLAQLPSSLEAAPTPVVIKEAEEEVKDVSNRPVRRPK